MSFFLFIFFLIVIIFSEKIDEPMSNIRNLQTESNEFDSIRIYVDDNCLGGSNSQSSYSSQNTTDTALTKRGVEKARVTLQKLVKVKRLKDPVNIYDYRDIIPTQFHDCAVNRLRNVVDADLIIFIRLVDMTDSVEKLIKFPQTNIIKYIDDNENNRPFIGTIIYNYIISDNEDAIVHALSTIFLHAFTHILGFSKKSLENKHLLSTKNVEDRINGNKRGRTFVIGSNVLRIARNYFNCQSLDGVEIDDFTNLDGNDNIHWHGRILLGDYMIADVYYMDQAISEITLALLEDLEWYKVNYYTGGLMKFGKHKGCYFINNDCIQGSSNPIGLKSSFQTEFCSNIYGNGFDVYGTCSSGRQSMGYCLNDYSVGEIRQIDQNYVRRNISLTQYGNSGYSQYKLVEFCPLFFDVNYDSLDRLNYIGSCKFGDSRYGQYLTFLDDLDEVYSFISQNIEEKYSSSSFCIFSSLLNKGTSNPNYINKVIRPTCYEMSCSELSLTIHLNDEFIVCPREGGTIKIDSQNYKGLLFCPDYNSICTGTKVCNNIFDCVDNKSTVKDLTFNYDYTPSADISMELETTDENLVTNYKSTDIYELGEEGICPQFCKQCKENKQCLECNSPYIYYMGKSEGDTEPLKCIQEQPTQKYYNFTDNNGKKYFYECIENCNLCFRNDKDICHQCIPTHYVNSSTAGKCVERIPGCIAYDESKPVKREDNGGADSYMECSKCNTTAGYYCLNKDKSTCNLMPDINMSIYALMTELTYPCYEKCKDRFTRCETCNSSTCIVCNGSNLYINNRGNCLDKIEHCITYDLTSETSSCSQCDENDDFYCIDQDRTRCQKISKTDIISYYKLTNNYDSCVKLCNETYNNTCLECNYTGCTKCKEGYFIYEGQCKKNMTGCIDNIVINPNPLTLECNNCDSNASYYCLNEDRSKCNFMEASNISMHYLLPDLNYSCYGLCGDIIEHCIECNTTNCFKCIQGYDVNRKKQYCLIPPTAFKEDVPCQVILKDDNTALNSNFNFNSTMINYFLNLDHVNKVEHFIGNNYTITLFINSNCTEGLLSEGYFKINNRELNRSFIEEGDIEYVYHTFAIYINYNYRSYLRFYDIEQNYLDPVDDCETCLEKNYYVTHNLYSILQDIIGTQFTELVTEKNLDIFSEESPIFTDSCENLTLYDIDVPINLRKKLLFFHEYFKPLMCRDIDCQLVEYNLTNKTSICECKIGKTFEDILNSPKFEFNPYNTDTDPKGFSEAVKVVKCLTKGIKYSSFKINTAAIICVIIFVLQCLLYFANNCYGQPYSDDLPAFSSTLANPPKSDSPTRIYLYSDWDLSNIQKGKEPVEEEEKVIQPRDDSGDQIMEEEKSLNNDIFSNVSIDTNAGGLFNDKKTNRSLRAAEKNKKVLILLGNNLKTKKKVSIEQSVNGKIGSENDESDDTPLGKRRKYDNSGFCRNYWIYLSVKQHIINFFGIITFCNMTKNYIPLTIKIIRSLFLVVLSLILSILWLDQKYIQKKWEHFNDKYSLLTTKEKNISISLSERISYALSHTIVHVIVDLIVLIFADFIIGVAFFKIKEEGDEIIELIKKGGNYRKNVKKLEPKAKNKNNIFFSIVFILVVVFFISLCGFGATYPGGVVDCVTSGIFAIILLEIIPFIWSLILALFRYLGYKKNNECMINFSEFFLY